MKNRLQTSYCATNEAIQIVGERWALLVVRDLLYGPRRFSDLLATVSGVTPKLLTTRLRELEASGVIHRDEEPGRRDVWYSLTEAGMALRPVIRELAGWGVRFGSLPEPNDEIMSRRAATACLSVLNRQDRYPGETVVWSIEVGDGKPARIGYDGRRWDLLDDDDPRPPDLMLATRPLPFVKLLRATGEGRRGLAESIGAEGSPEQLAAFLRVFSA